MSNMISEKFSRTTSLLLIATFALAMASTVSAAGVGEMGDNGLPAFLSDGADDGLETLTFFLRSEEHTSELQSH